MSKIEETRKSLKEYGLKNNIPLICDQGLEFILNLIKIREVKSILEVGTAIGYSSLCFYNDKITIIDTIERNNDLFSISNSYLKPLKVPINLILACALEYKLDKKKKYDLIFIDAAKAQYEKFFIKYKEYLNHDGIIVCDNLNFHNLDISQVGKNTKQLLRKINKFKDFLKDNQEFNTEFFSTGDGISVSIRK